MVDVRVGSKVGVSYLSDFDPARTPTIRRQASIRCVVPAASATLRVPLRAIKVEHPV
jgi:hypothetical protein